MVGWLEEMGWDQGFRVFEECRQSGSGLWQLMNKEVLNCTGSVWPRLGREWIACLNSSLLRLVGIEGLGDFKEMNGMVAQRVCTPLLFSGLSDLGCNTI